ncbi:hypothetical protein L1987_39764 [Smallanthus sonchifolius]|uniref:Uncharacterized protein n=1 Tax=Smallanthus sonchifolius TaxID=185202 RepID=A0ACB9HMX4_9ASTR|nr:hypothetical protein L1987_39764 [Smallanthus sonchifolius]
MLLLQSTAHQESFIDSSDIQFSLEINKKVTSIFQGVRAASSLPRYFSIVLYSLQLGSTSVTSTFVNPDIDQLPHLLNK